MNEWTHGCNFCLELFVVPMCFLHSSIFHLCPTLSLGPFPPRACAQERSISGGLVGKAPLVVVHLSFTLLKGISTGQPELVTGYLLAAFCDRNVLPLNSHSYPVGKSDVSLIAAVWRPFVFSLYLSGSQMFLAWDSLKSPSLRIGSLVNSGEASVCRLSPLSLSTVGLSMRTLWFSTPVPPSPPPLPSYSSTLGLFLSDSPTFHQFFLSHI